MSRKLNPPELHVNELVNPVVPHIRREETLDVLDIGLEKKQAEGMWNRRHVHPGFTDIPIDSRFNHKEFEEWVNRNPYRSFEELVTRCLRYPNLASSQYYELCPYSSTTLCRKVFATRSLNIQFVEAFYTLFFPLYLAGMYSWLSIDLIIRASHAYPSEFVKLLQIMITTRRVPNNVLQDYVMNINAEKRTELMEVFCLHNLTSEQFTYNLRTLNIVFSNCKKTPTNCQYIIEHLVVHHYLCYNNKHFGRLFLSYLKNYSVYPVDHDSVHITIENHGTEYQGPCRSMFDNIIEEMIDEEHEQYRPRCIITCSCMESTRRL